MCNIKFNKSIYFSDIKHFKLDENNIDFVKINKISSAREYDNFIIKELYKYIETKHILIVQHDGIIYQSHNWDDNFLNYDYIGATWPSPPKNGNHVGNGGFSLRSKKFMEQAAKELNNQYCNEAEDVYLCGTLFRNMIKNNFKYADIETATKFSVELEWSRTHRNTFGFHLAACNSIDIHRHFRDKIYEDLHKNWR